MRSQERLDRISELTDLPLTLLAMLLVPILVVPEIVDLPSNVEAALVAADWTIWAAFAVDYIIRLVVAPRRGPFIWDNALELLMISLPFLRPFRALKALRLLRVGVVLGLNIQLLDDLMARRATRSIGLIVLAVLFGGSYLTLLAERDADGANITNINDALWWGVTTMTTVGYGDRYPVTDLGRAVAIGLMLLGIAALSALTATIAAYLVQEKEDVQLADVMSELKSLRQQIEAMSAPDGGQPAGGGTG